MTVMAAQPVRGTLFQAGYVVRDMDAAIATARDRFGVANWHVKPLDNGILTGIGMAWVGDFMWEYLGVDPESCPDFYRDFVPADPAAAVFNHIGYKLATEAEFEAVMAGYAAAGVGTAIQMDLPDQLRCYYADTLPQLGHYTEYVWEMPGGSYFADAPRN
jgi:hypothetical protein